jgi:hypothetical protein
VKPARSRHAARWWAKNVIVPIIGGGGAVTLFVALAQNRKNEPEVVGPDSTTRLAPQDNTAWRADWITINESVPHLGEGGRQFTNRVRYNSRLQRLDLAGNPTMRSQRDGLLLLVQQAPRAEQPFYDMVVPDELESHFSKLKDAIRVEVIGRGIDTDIPSR